jgi:diaminopimelate epimerase|tara:strand:+ start:5988 stop:6815 length:828 start_codon:yes stop_codon:yes gene_type:complete
MHGLGNDFLMLDLISQNIQIRDERIRCLADRHLGIGFDQMLMVEPPQDPAMDFRFRIFNADGSEAEQCGNGARCFTRFVRDRGLTTKTELKLETMKGPVECKLQKDGNITVNMGAPRLQPDCIPFIADATQISYNLQLEDGLCANRTSIDISAVSMGNPHAVLLVEDVDTASVKTLGPVLETHARFPQGVNVGFMEVIDRKNIRLRVYERGTGETRACGSGACAAVVTGRLQGLLEEEVNVHLPGGTLTIEWKGDDSPVLQTGPACRVYEGHLLI